MRWNAVAVVDLALARAIPVAAVKEDHEAPGPFGGRALRQILSVSGAITLWFCGRVDSTIVAG